MNEQDLKDVAYGMLSAMVNEKGMRKNNQMVVRRCKDRLGEIKPYRL